MPNFYVNMESSSRTLDYNCDCYLIDASSNSITLSLPAIVSDGFGIRFVRVDNNGSNTVTLDASPSNFIALSSTSTISLPVSGKLSIISCANNWYVVG